MTTKGIDVSQLVTTDQFKLIKKQECNFAIVRAYRSIGEPDGNAAYTLRNAEEAKFDNIDVYMFPKPKSTKSATEQVQEMG